MINVAFVFEDSRFGGPHAQAVATIKKIKGINFKVLISNKSSHIFRRKLRHKKIIYEEKDMHSISLNFNSLLKYIFFFIRDFFTIFFFLRKNDIDIVHIPGGLYFFKTVLAAKLARKKIIWHIHDEQSNPILKYIFYFIRNNINYFLFASYSSLKYYKKYLPLKAKKSVIQSTIDDKFFRLKRKISNKILILTVANISPVKDIETIILAAKQLEKYKNDISFIIIGQVWDSQKKYFHKILKMIYENKISNIKIIDKFTDPVKFYSNSSIYICSSLNESSPMAVWEAMSSGLPIITTPCGDIKYLLKNNFNTLIFNKKNYNSLAKKIIYLINNKKVRNKISKNAKITAYNEFLAQKNIPKIKNIYNEIY